MSPINYFYAGVILNVIILNVIILNVIILNVIILNVIMLNVIILNVDILYVEAPNRCLISSNPYLFLTIKLTIESFLFLRRIYDDRKTFFLILHRCVFSSSCGWLQNFKWWMEISENRQSQGATTLGITTFGIMTLRITMKSATLGRKKLSITSLSLMTHTA